MNTAAFRRRVELEDRHWWSRGRRVVYGELLRSHLGSARVRRALDVGSGAGGFVGTLADIADEVHALDVQRQTLRRATTRGAACVQASADRLPYADATFDLVCLCDVLEHLDDDCAALREARRVLRPGGVLFASVPARPWPFGNDDRVAGRTRRYTRPTLRLSAARSRLRVERCTHTNVFLFPLIAPVVLATRLAERVGILGSGPRRRGSSWRIPRTVHALLTRIFRSELVLTSRFDVPLGHSIAMIARRKLGSRQVLARRVEAVDAVEHRRAA